MLPGEMKVNKTIVKTKCESRTICECREDEAYLQTICPRYFEVNVTCTDPEYEVVSVEKRAVPEGVFDLFKCCPDYECSCKNCTDESPDDVECKPWEDKKAITTCCTKYDCVCGSSTSHCKECPEYQKHSSTDEKDENCCFNSTCICEDEDVLDKLCTKPTCEKGHILELVSSLDCFLHYHTTIIFVLWSPLTLHSKAYYLL